MAVRVHQALQQRQPLLTRSAQVQRRNMLVFQQCQLAQQSGKTIAQPVGHGTAARLVRVRLRVKRGKRLHDFSVHAGDGAVMAVAVSKPQTQQVRVNWQYGRRQFLRLRQLHFVTRLVTAKKRSG